MFDLTNPAEASQWHTEEHDTTQGPSGLQHGLFRLASGPDSPAIMERRVDFDSQDFNRMTIDMRVVSRSGPGADAGGMVGSAVFLFDDEGNVIPESRILTNTPVGVRSSVVIRLDQSVFWTGRVQRIRFDPVWGVGRADIATITLDKEPPPEPAPQFFFNNRDTSAGWMIGEFDESTGAFLARPTAVDTNGISFTTRNSSPVLQHLGINLNADLIRSAELVVRTAQPVSSTARLFWTSPGTVQAVSEKSMTHSLNPTTSWQTLRFDLRSHPEWAGQVGFILLNPMLHPGSVQIRSLRFEAIEGLGGHRDEDALVLWRTHHEVGNELVLGNYKPLLVLVTLDDNPFSRAIELDLAANRDFLTRAESFHAVRMQFHDPATSRVFTDIYRIPVLATMTYDFQNRQWQVRDRLVGADVGTGAVAIMDAVLANP